MFVKGLFDFLFFVLICNVYFFCCGKLILMFSFWFLILWFMYWLSVFWVILFCSNIVWISMFLVMLNLMLMFCVFLMLIILFWWDLVLSFVFFVVVLGLKLDFGLYGKGLMLLIFLLYWILNLYRSELLL